MRRLLAALTLLGAGTLLAACGGGGVPASPTALTTAPPLTATPGTPPTRSASASVESAAASATPTSAPTLPPATATPTTAAPTSPPPTTAALATPTAPPPPPPPSVSSVTVTAENLAFDRAVIRVKAGVTLTATLVNKDTGVDHNLAFSLPGLGHPTCLGPCTVSQTLTPTQPGAFSFFCTLHATMFGDFIVE